MVYQRLSAAELKHYDRMGFNVSDFLIAPVHGVAPLPTIIENDGIGFAEAFGL